MEFYGKDISGKPQGVNVTNYSQEFKQHVFETLGRGTDGSYLVIIRSALNGGKALKAVPFSKIGDAKDYLKNYKAGVASTTIPAQPNSQLQSADIENRVKELKKKYPNMFKALDLYAPYAQAFKEHEKAKDALDLFNDKVRIPDDAEAEDAYWTERGALELAESNAKSNLDDAEKKFNRYAEKSDSEWNAAKENGESGFIYKDVSKHLGVDNSAFDFFQ